MNVEQLIITYAPTVLTLITSAIVPGIVSKFTKKITESNEIKRLMRELNLTRETVASLQRIIMQDSNERRQNETKQDDEKKQA